MGCHAVMNTSFRRYRFLSRAAKEHVSDGGGGINESIAKLVGSVAPKRHCRDYVLPGPPAARSRCDHYHSPPETKFCEPFP